MANAFPLLRARLQHIGLSLNDKKCEVYYDGVEPIPLQLSQVPVIPLEDRNYLGAQLHT